MAFPINWTEEDEKKALEGIDIERKDDFDLFSFKTFREQLVNEHGWTGNREETELMYAIFDLFIDDVDGLSYVTAYDYNTIEDKNSILSYVEERVNELQIEKEDNKSYAVFKTAYDKVKAEYDEKYEKYRQEEKERHEKYWEGIDNNGFFHNTVIHSAEEDKKEEAHADDRKEEIPEEKAGDKDPEVISEEERRRREIEKMMEEAEARAEAEERKKTEEENRKKEEQEELIKNSARNRVRKSWIEWEASKRLAEMGQRPMDSFLIVDQAIRDYYRQNGVEVEVGEGEDLHTIKKDFYGNLDEIRPKDWTEDEEKEINRYVDAVIKGREIRKIRDEAEEKAAREAEAEERKLPRMTPAQIKNIHDEVKRLREKGIDIVEFEQSMAYDDYCTSKGYSYREAERPVQFAIMSVMGPGSCKALQKYNVKQYEATMEALKDIENIAEKSMTDDKKFGVCDTDAFGVGRWLNVNGFKDLAIDGDEKNMKDVIPFDFENALNKAGKDRDNVYGFDMGIIDQARQLYLDNKQEFDSAFDSMSNLGGRKVAGPEVLAWDTKNLKELNEGKGRYEGKDTLKKLNEFCHLLYKVKQQDEKICKLGTDKEPVYVKPLGEDTNLTNLKDQMDEMIVLDTCLDMLEKSKSKNWNSGEYKKIISGIEELKNILNKDYDSAEKAEQAYAKGIKKVLKDINLYRKHKANDGIKQDVTLDKLVNVERIDKLLKGRYESLAGEVYGDVISEEGKTADVVVDQNIKSGRNYMLALAVGKVHGISKNMIAINDGLSKEQTEGKEISGRETVKNKVSKKDIDLLKEVGGLGTNKAANKKNTVPGRNSII
ncbi:MAG: hypothetical protein K5929_09660 [Lachnospiraceae bacterium]|nr:hypothetical protein [Lachnospiraceae bacterium]